MAKNTKDIPIFNNPELEEAAKSTAPAFASYLSSLDKISQDIRALENFLQGFGVSKDFGDFCLLDDEVNKECVEWTRDEKSGKHRLNFAVYKYRQESSQSLAIYYEDLVSRTPLIESPANVRLRAANCLPDFVKYFAKEVEKLKDIQLNPA